MLIVQGCEFMNDGDGYYRLHEPSRFLGRLPGVTVIDCHFYHREFRALAEACDVLILPFIYHCHLFKLIERRREQGKITVFETNDYYHDMQPWNPIGEAWLDPDLRIEHLRYVETADAIQTSSPRLRDHWKGVAREIAVFPNQLSEVPELRPPPERALTVGWGGSGSHLADWSVLSQSLQPWLEQHEEVHLSVMTYYVAEEYFQLPEERYSFREAGELSQYNDFLQTLDIGIAPLLPTEYNRCRSDVKFLEYASHGVVGIYADLEPYRETVIHGETGFLYKSEEELLEYLNVLRDDVELREKIRSRAYEYVRDERRLEQHIQSRADFYRSLCSPNAKVSSVPNEVIALAVSDGDYHRLEKGEKEEVLLQLVSAKADQNSLGVARKLYAFHPAWLSLAQALARILNELDRPYETITLVEEALNIEREDPRLLLELGRAHFFLKNHQAANQFIAASVQSYPNFIQGWLAYLNFARLTSEVEKNEVRERARLHNPDSYKIALHSALLFSREKQLPNFLSLVKEFRKKLTEAQWRYASPEFLRYAKSFLKNQEASLQIEVLEQVEEDFADSPTVLHFLGLAHRRLGNHNVADEYFREAMKLRQVYLQVKAETTEHDKSYRYWEVADFLLRFPDKESRFVPKN